MMTWSNPCWSWSEKSTTLGRAVLPRYRPHLYRTNFWGCSHRASARPRGISHGARDLQSVRLSSGRLEQKREPTARTG
ncbi:hypothetical protein BD626DRAFT_157365 [Schizophyllum amplum]|uniref:Uncharacterized protein n=1 Tax=Schizophyllum amplum TaxID=97359 RepID=A0A550C3F3_9AGAR|nr:hypothetical protein BD626DRAFT_157365 [Auriculariopsis ampla]